MPLAGGAGRTRSCEMSVALAVSPWWPSASPCHRHHHRRTAGSQGAQPRVPCTRAACAPPAAGILPPQNTAEPDRPPLSPHQGACAPVSCPPVSPRSPPQGETCCLRPLNGRTAPLGALGVEGAGSGRTVVESGVAAPGSRGRSSRSRAGRKAANASQASRALCVRTRGGSAGPCPGDREDIHPRRGPARARPLTAASASYEGRGRAGTRRRPGVRRADPGEPAPAAGWGSRAKGLHTCTCPRVHTRSRALPGRRGRRR